MLAARSAVRIATTSVKQVRGAANGIKIESFSNDILPIKGVDAAKNPQKVTLEAGKSYAWCACGLSTKQPFCDGTHKLPGVTSARPVKFQVEKTGEYRMCACKQTDKRPLCDGSHKTMDQTPRNDGASRMVAFGEDSAVYDGVAHKLGYRPKNGGFQ